jgi:hypothetical protein
MEKFNLNNKTYYVKWEYCDGLFDNKPDTFCHIYEEEDILVPISVGSAWVSKNDVFNKKIGRKISFTRALVNYFNKQERTEIWYFATTEFKTKLIDDAKNKKK